MDDAQRQFLLDNLKSPQHLKKCYDADNNFAYKFDTHTNYDLHLKCFNFVPTYDTWCVVCDKKNCTLRCSKCKSVYFCNKECQKKAWSVHKKHCGRNLFTICSACGKSNPQLKCNNCPVKFCDEKCKRDIYGNHCEFDCEHMKLFNFQET